MQNNPNVRPLFPLGQVVATPGALRALQEAEQLPAAFLDRHVTGDWGELGDEDKQANERALREGLRIFSAYTTSAGVTSMLRRVRPSVVNSPSCCCTMTIPPQYSSGNNSVVADLSASVMTQSFTPALVV